jgi:hypothetical protein
MTNRPTITWSIWLYQKLLCLYPPEFRNTWSGEMVQVFTSQCRQTANERALLGLWLVTIVDLLTSVMEEVLMTSHSKRQLIMVTGLFGLAAGIVGGVNAITYPALVGELGEKVVFSFAMSIIVGLAFGSGLIAARISKNAITGLWVGLLVGVIASLIANTTRVGFSIAFYDIVRNDPSEIRDWMHRGGGSFVDYLIEDRIGGYIYTTLFLGLVGGVCGMVGGLVSHIRSWPSRINPV